MGWMSLVIQVATGGVVYCIGTLVFMYFFKRELLGMGVKEVKRKLKRGENSV